MLSQQLVSAQFAEAPPTFHAQFADAGAGLGRCTGQSVLFTPCSFDKITAAMTAVLKGYIAAPVGTERKMAGLQLLPTSNIHNGGPTTRVDELSELSGLIAREEDEYEDRDTDTEYHMVQKEEAADMPPNFPRSVSGHGCRSYGATSSPAAVKRRRRRQARKHSRPHSRGSSGFLSPQPHLYSLQPHALRQDHEYNHLNHLHEQHRRFYSTTAIPQVHTHTHTHTH